MAKKYTKYDYDFYEDVLLSIVIEGVLVILFYLLMLGINYYLGG